MGAQQTARVFRAGDHGPELPIVEGTGSARAIVWPGVGAKLRSMQQIRLAAGSRTVPLRHTMEAVYYVMRGGGTARDPDDGSSDALIEGSMVHIDPGTAYVFEAGPDGIELLGGPCPADSALYPRSGDAQTT